MSAALRITPSDDDKFLSVEALDLEPSAPVRLVPAICALRHDAFETTLAGQPVELPAASSAAFRWKKLRSTR
jgi:hypothetical protein